MPRRIVIAAVAAVLTLHAAAALAHGPTSRRISSTGSAT
jgi:hypothetical protein